jgi:probable HAF family extracellular repeat protein
LSGGVFTTLDDPWAVRNGIGTGTFLSGINSSGQVVGRFTDAMSNEHGFLLSGGTFTTIDSLGYPGH